MSGPAASGMIRNLLVFTTAAALEIGGCFAFWAWLRRDASAAIAVIGLLSLAGFAWSLTRSDAAFAGRAYAHTGVSISQLRWRGCGWLRPSGRPLRTYSAQP